VRYLARGHRVDAWVDTPWVDSYIVDSEDIITILCPEVIQKGRREYLTFNYW
jgi:hypothetical protein